MQANSSGVSGPRLRWRLASWAAVWLLIAYLGIVLPLDRAFPVVNRWFGAVALLALSGYLTYAALKRWLWQGTDADERTKNVLMLAAMTLVSFLAADVGTRLYRNLNPDFVFDTNKYIASRERDANEWDGELMPKYFYPTSGNFMLYKPGQIKVGESYGEHYYPALLRHPVMRDSVLKTHRVEFDIDKYGLRNVDDPATARIFALGDSFCFGYHTSQEHIFTTRLKSMLGEPVYNMGVSATSPMQQYLLFEHLVRTYPEAFKPRQLLWLIFEGNDLEETYDTQAPSPEPPRSLKANFEGTIVSALVSIPGLIRSESIIRLLTGGEVELTNAPSTSANSKHYLLDGDLLANPLYHSQRFGHKMFRQLYLDRGVQPESYVRNHPNAPLLADTFRRMKALSQEKGFEVTIVIVPSEARLYKDAFEDFPPISKEPHFINYVKELSDKEAFKTVDLYALLAPYAEKEMIHYRDDTHWTERGHEIVAEILAKSAVVATH